MTEMDTPLSWTQERIWFEEQLRPGDAAYNMPVALRVQGPLDTARLRRAFDILADRHEALRTVFDTVDGVPVQRTVEGLTVPVETQDVRALPDPAAAAATALRRASRARFDLARGPLLRVLVVRTADEEHLLLLTAHHLIADGWSFGLLLQELSRVYAEPAVPGLRPLRRTYADAVRAERAELDEAAVDRLVDWWRRHLDGVPRVLELPADRPRPAVRGHRGARRRLAVDAATAHAVRELARSQEATPFMALLAAFGVVLARHTGQERMVVGTPASTRGAGTRDLVGCFLNTLPVKVDAADDPTFAELLGRVRRDSLDAFGHQRVPFGRLISGLAPERDLSRNQLVQVFFNVLPPSGVPDLAGCRVEALPFGDIDNKFDLTLYVGTEADGGLTLDAVYDAALYEGERVADLLEQLRGVLARASAEPGLRVSEFALSTPRSAALRPDPAAELPVSVTESLLDRLAKHTAVSPQAPALVAGTTADGGVWSYAELDRATDRLARVLRERGIRPGDVLALHAARHPAVVLGILAAVKAGAVFSVLDADYPDEALSARAQALSPRAWLACAPDRPLPAFVTGPVLRVDPARERELARTPGDLPEGRVPSDGTPTGPLAGASRGPREDTAVPPDDSPSTPQGSRASAPGTAATGGPVPGRPGRSAQEMARDPGVLDPDVPAYIAFTSGTTGRPRPVLGGHRPLVHFLDWYARAFDLGPVDRFAALSGLGHDPFLRDVLAPLWAGAAVVFPDADVRDVRAVGEWLRAAGATVAHLTPALGGALAEQADGEPWPRLRLVGFGGDTLTGRTVRDWARLAPGADLLNMYGATETPQAVSVHRVHRAGSAADPRSGGPVPLGPGIDGVQLLVLAGDRPAGLGEVGELVVRTPYLARYADDRQGGYVPDPFAPGSGARVYRTGDLARLRPDGLIEPLGRADQQIKVRGFRVEPAEVEAALDALPGVAHSAVLGVPDASGERGLVAYLATGPTALAPARGVTALIPATAPTPLDLADVRAALARRLPEYAVPASYVVLDTLPLTANSKVDRAALRALGVRAERATGAYVAPEGPVERRIAELWGELLGRERIGAGDDFFALGGHSLLLTRLLARIRREFHGDVTLQDLFERPTVAGLAPLLSRPETPGTPDGGPVVARGDVTAPGPLSWTQERLWLEEQLRPGDAAYNMPVVLRLRGALDDAALQSAVDTVVARHAVLRTVFEAGPDGTPLQRAVDGARVLVRHADLSGAPDPESAAVAAAMRGIKEPFDLTRGPLLRAELLRIGQQDQLLVLTVHHIAFDGWSFGLLLRELSRAYAGDADQLPEQGIQFADVARWERTDLSGPALDSLLDWWRRHLDGVPRVLELPTDRPRPAVGTHRGARRRLTVDAPTAAGLRELSRSHGGTLFMTLLSAYSVVLSRHTGQDSLLVGTPVANRPRAEFEDLLGCFLNTLPLRVDLHGDPSFPELLGRVRDTSLEAFAHQRVPYGRLVNELVPERDLSRSPLVQVLFALQNVELGTLEVQGVDSEFVDISEANSQFDLNLRMIDTGQELIGWLDYDVELFDAATIERFVEHFTRVLTAVVAEPAAPVSTVDLLGPAERALLVDEWNDTAVDRPQRETLTGLLAEAAVEYADAPAVRFEDSELSYDALHRRANRLAHRLRALGVGPDTVVGVHLARSPELMVALLAVLKAGGAYLPLDPGYPAGRLEFMLTDSGAPVLLTAAGAEAGLATEGLTVVPVDERAGDGHPDTEPEPVAGPDHLAYVIYTSGSTGRPKGVQVPHRGIANRLRWMQDTYGLTGADTVLQKTPISFDVSVWELFWPLLTGARLVLAAPGGHRDPGYLAELIQRESVTVCHFVPPMLEAFLGAGRAGECRSLRLVVCSGEALPAELARRFHRTLDQAELENLYGPTEASVDVTRWSSRPDWTGPALPIGTPIANTRTYVLDARLLPAPIGVPGELHLGGVQLARGYGGRPGLTADRFVPDPFGPPGSRLYRTGDIARWNAEGRIEYLGRADHQVKVRGFRIELGEIEAALLAVNGITQAVAIVREDQPGDRRIVAYVVYVTGERAPSVGELRTALGERLPEHMIPAAHVVLDALPLSPNGKVDRKALPAPDRSGGTSAAYVAPGNPQEERLVALWQRVLGVDRVGVRDNFFEIGGDSMHAVRIVGLAREDGQDIPLQRLFTSQTVEALAQWLATRTDSGAGRREVAAFGLLSPEDLARLKA
ncbi:amino acid adenylation domain-containing protein [Streptomyces sp. NBC_00035]|uniref:amino acid adenylation domain-containing protein n=1 Tax=Streptomyces sp. NBC_00035 TaxID=2903614 RepID=UPI00324DE484